MTAREAGVVVGTLVRALLDGSRDLGTVPALLVRIIDEDLWRDRVDPASGRPYRFRSWEQFVATPGPEGLGSSDKQLRGVCAGNTKALDALDRVTKRPAHIHADVDNVHVRPAGNSQAAALRRLRKDRPDLHAKVLTKELSADKAMVEAGFRPRRITVRITSPETIAATLERHLDRDTRRKLAALLADDL